MNFDERDDPFSNEYDEADDDTQADDSFASLQDRARNVGVLLFYDGADYRVEKDGLTTHYPRTLAKLQEVIEELENQAEQDAVQGTLSDEEMSAQDVDEYLEEESDELEEDELSFDETNYGTPAEMGDPDRDDPGDDSPQELGRTIERGVQFLTENFPGWHHYVDLDTLDVASAYECPMAQASKQGDYLLGYYETDVPSYERRRHAQRHGFLDGDEFSGTDLNMGWQVAVRILRLSR